MHARVFRIERLWCATPGRADMAKEASDAHRKAGSAAPAGSRGDFVFEYSRLALRINRILMPLPGSGVAALRAHARLRQGKWDATDLESPAGCLLASLTLPALRFTHS